MLKIDKATRIKNNQYHKLQNIKHTKFPHDDLDARGASILVSDFLCDLVLSCSIFESLPHNIEIRIRSMIIYVYC